MLNDKLKQHLNQIDTSLKSAFETVNFEHKQDGYYSLISVSDNTVKEDLAAIRVILKVEHTQLNNDSSHVNWSYSINPEKEDSRSITRKSLIENIGNDVLDIVLNKRMDKNYIDNCLVSLVNESDEIESEDSKLESEPNIIDIEDSEEDEFQIGESVIFTDYAYNEVTGTIEKKISLTILDKEYPGYVIKTGNGDRKDVMAYDVHKDSRMPKWWNN